MATMAMVCTLSVFNGFQDTVADLFTVFVSTLGTGIRFVDPLQIYIPKRSGKVNMANPAASFNMDYLYSPGVVFVVNQQKYDGQYILTSLDFARRLLDYTTEVSAIELKLKPGSDLSFVKAKIKKELGE